MTSIAQSVLLMCHDQLLCFVLFFCRVRGYGLDGYGVDHMVSFGGLFHFSCSVVDFIFVFSPSSSGDVKGLQGIYAPQV